MQKYKRSLGQNFLHDKNIIKKIINLDLVKDKSILEIGPGNGALTFEIIKKNPKNLTLVEKDKDLFKNLNEKIKYTNYKILNEDIMNLNVESILEKDSIIFGNLPYNISTQILVKFIKFNSWPPNYSKLIFMFQKEVAEKIISSSNKSDYGRLNIISNYRLKIKDYFLVKKNCFIPKPKVESMVLLIEPKIPKIEIKDLSNLEFITNIFFSQKRKIIKKTFKKIFKDYKLYAEKLGLSLRERPSELTPNKYYQITEMFENIN